MSSKSNPTVTAPTRTKVRPHGDRRQAEGASVALARRTPPGSPLRIGTLSWEGEEPWVQSPGELLASLTAAGTWGVCDLIVTAGLTVYEAPAAEAVLAASGGTPVLFEAESDGGDYAWLLVRQGNGGPAETVVRERQLLYRSGEVADMTRLAGVIASGAGVIDFEGTDLRLVLFICGENNLLQPDAGPSVLRAVSDDQQAAGPEEVVGGTWAVLNPAHKPYLKQQIKTSGFGKIAQGTNSAGTFGPTLKRLVDGRRQFRDGTTAPVALLHVNNFSPRHPKTVPYASVCFGDTAERVIPVGDMATGEVPREEPGRTRQWQASVYELQVGER